MAATGMAHMKVLRQEIPRGTTKDQCKLELEKEGSAQNKVGR